MRGDRDKNAPIAGGAGGGEREGWAGEVGTGMETEGLGGGWVGGGVWGAIPTADRRAEGEGTRMGWGESDNHEDDERGDRWLP